MSRSLVVHLAKIAGISGAEAHLLSLLPDLRDRGWELRFCMLHEHEPGAQEFARELEARGIAVDQISLAADVDPIAFVRLVTYLARRRPALLHTHLVHADVYGQLAGPLAGVPVRFSTKHGFNEFREDRGFAVADRAIARFAQKHIAISRGLARYLAETEGFSEHGFEIVHYGIAPTDGAPAPAPAGPLRLLCIGRLIPIKGHMVLLRALADVLPELPEVTLDIAGRGPLEPALRAFTKELGIEASVRFRGYVSPIQSAIEESGAVVVPSLGEGFGMVALEAMERARPVIAARVGGLEDLVADGATGLLVPSAEVEPLAHAIRTLAREPDLARRMGEAGRRRALEVFAERRCTDRTEILYRSVLDGRADMSA